MTPTTARTTTRDGFRPDVEGMRGLAVLVVVLFHAGVVSVSGGFVGVDVFFVISGFLITGLLVREHERSDHIDLLKFYSRRMRRLLPAGVVVMVVTLVVALPVVAPLDRSSVSLDAAASALSVANIRFALASGDYFATVTTPSPFLHFWSLSVEEQFYLVWPAMILLVARGVHSPRRVMVALMVIFATSFASNLFLTDNAPNWAFYSLPTRAWELALGGMLAVGATALARIPDRVVGVAGWFGLAAIVVASLAFDPSMPYPGMAVLLPCLGSAALIAGGSRTLGPGWLMSIRPMGFLGKISYSLYLVHWPILVLAPLVVGRELDDAARAALVGVAVILAWVSWKFIETPFRTGLPNLARRPGRTVSVGLTSVVSVAVLSVGLSFGMAPVDTVAAFDTSVTDTSSADPTSNETAEPTDEPWTDGAATPTPATRPTSGPAGTDAPAATPVAPIDIANTGALPADVRPTLAKARSDEERLRRDGCLAFESVTVPPRCVYGVKDGAFTIALVGDSHAAHWFPAIERLAKHEGWRVVTFVKVSCPFIDMPVRNLLLKRKYRECDTFNDATIARLKTLKPDLTLVSSSRVATHPMTAADDTVAAKGAAVGRMLARVPGRVAIIVDTPYAKRDIPGCLSSHKDDIGACAISHKDAFTGDLGAVEALAAEASGAGLIDLTARICVKDPCPVVVNDMIVYRDEAHLTATFARSLAPALGAAIAALLAK